MLRLVPRQAAKSLRAAAIVNNARRAVRDLHASTRVEALTKFTMPAMSPTMTEGGIATWKKKEGDTFTAGDMLLEIETDKATMDVEAQDDGKLVKIIVGDGSKAVPVGKAIAILAEESDDVDAAEVEKLVSEAESEPSKEAETKEEAPKQAAPKKESPKKEAEAPKQESPKKESKKAPSGTRQAIFASPAAKRIALEQGIPLGQIKGSGPNGRILEKDIESYKPSGGASSAASSGAGAVAPAFTDKPVSGMRRTIAGRLTESKRDTPHYYVTAEINMDKITQLRSLFNTAAQVKGNKEGVKEGTKVSVNDFIMKGAALALADVPEVNSGWHGDFVRQYETADISMAVATPSGLITPIVKNVGARGLASISAESKSLASKARDGKLQSHEYQGGSFTISNLGMFGVHAFTAIVNPPQSCILAVGGSDKKLVLDPTSEKGFKEVEIMKVTLSCDHRVVDGAVGARWLQSFKSYMESPLSFML